MASLLLFCQVGVALLAGTLAYRYGTRILGFFMGLKIVARRLSRLRDPSCHWTIRFSGVFDPLLDRFVRPSLVLSRELALTRLAQGMNDVVFQKLRLSISLAVLFLSLATWTGIIAFSSNGSIRIGLIFSMMSFIFVYVMFRVRLLDRFNLIRRQISREFPVFLDAMALTLEGGHNFQGALQSSVTRFSANSMKPGLQTEFLEVLKDIRAGRGRIDSLQRMADRVDLPEIRQFVSVISVADRQGVSVAPLLRKQAQQLRTMRALRAEKHAMKLPVKLLAPLALCIFPCTFLVIAFPVGHQLLRTGLF